MRAGRATRFTDFFVQGELAQGRIEVVDDGSGPDGIVLVTLSPPDRPELQSVQEGRVQNGVFEFAMRQAAESGWEATAYFTGGFDTAPCQSETVMAP